MVSANHNVFAVVFQKENHIICFLLVVDLLLSLWSFSSHPLPKHQFKIPQSRTVFSTKFNDIQEQLESIAGLDDLMSGW